MTSNEYIVKNCPANYQNNCRTAKVNEYNCQDCTDCVIKQVIEKCKKVRDTYCYAEKNNPRWQDANDVLKLFDIEEVTE